MKYKNVLHFLGAITLFIGFFLAFLPHTAHVAAGLDDEAGHIEHVISGMSLVVAGIAILVHASKQKHLN